MRRKEPDRGVSDLNILYVGSSSACLEVENSCPYYAPETYDVLLNGEVISTGNTTNVFSVYNLSPDTDYEVEMRFSGGDAKPVWLHTASESCCVSVKEFGAVGDGVHEDTSAIQAAINMLPAGGRLLFPAGTYLTLPVQLRSHITLELSEGAKLLASTDRERFPIIPGFATDVLTGREIPFASFEGLEQASYQSIIHGEYVEDVNLIGSGTVDGNAQNGDWWKDFKSFPAKRPQLLFLNRCNRITVHGVQFCNSPAWNLHPYYSKHISFYDCSVTAPKVSPNTDACDPESCDSVNIIGCKFSVGDDCIAIKSGKIETCRKYRSPANRHVIRNCLMAYGHGAVTLGSEAACGVTNLSVTQCLFQKTDRGLRIKSRRGRGKDSVINNVRFDNIRMESVLTPIVINQFYNCCDPDSHSEYVWSREKLPVDDRTPRFGSFRFTNMECIGAEVAACYIDGLPEVPIEKITMENISIGFSAEAQPGVPSMKEFAQPQCRMGLYMDNVKHIRLHNVTLDGVEGEKLIAQHYETIDSDLK